MLPRAILALAAACSATENHGDAGSPQGEEYCPEWPGDLHVGDAAELEAFRASGATCVGGSVEVIDTPLTGLQPLDSLVRIGGNLRIERNSALGCLCGLERLEEVLGAIIFAGNTAVAEITTLSALATIGEGLYIGSFDADGYVGNPGLRIVGGLDALTTLGRVEIWSNDSLERVDLPGLVTHTGEVEILGNQRLVEISGFSALERCRWLQVARNAALERITAFSRLREIEEYLVVAGNDVLEDVSGLFSLSRVPVAQINSNPRLPTCMVEELLGDICDLSHCVAASCDFTHSPAQVCYEANCDECPCPD